MTQAILKKVYRPSLTVGQLYARRYGSSDKPTPVGNVLELQLEHDEDVQKQEDMTRVGGGIHAEVRRITDIKVSMKLADLNVTNLTRAVLGTATGIDGGSVASEAHTVQLGGLLRLAHIGASNVTVRKGGALVAVTDEEHLDAQPNAAITTAHAAPLNVVVYAGASYGTKALIDAQDNYTVTATGIQLDANPQDITTGHDLWVSYSYAPPGGAEVEAAGNFEARPEGIYILPDAQALSDSDVVHVSYDYGEYAVIEAITEKAPELELTFGGLNEADSGKPTLVEIWRVSQSVTKQLALLGKDFGAIDVEGTVLQDPSKTGAGVSRYYRTSLV